MIRTFIRFALVLVVLGMLVQGVVMAQAMSTARGIIKDTDGNVLKGVRVLFRNTAQLDVVYDTVTNKKGRYYIDNLLYYQNRDGRSMWKAARKPDWWKSSPRTSGRILRLLR